MSTITAPLPSRPRQNPAPELTVRHQNPLEDLIRRGLTNDTVWRDLMADPEKKSAAEAWLRTTKKSIEDQLHKRNLEFNRYRSEQFHSDFAEKRREFSDWRTRAVHLQNLCDRRLGELKVLRITQNEDLQNYRQPLILLVRAIRDLDLGSAAPEDVISLIDTLVLPDAAGNAPTLRQAITAMEQTPTESR